MPETIARMGFASQDFAQIFLRCLSRFTREPEEVEADRVQEQARDTAPQRERNPHDEADGQRIAAFRLLHPSGWGLAFDFIRRLQRRLPSRLLFRQHRIETLSFPAPKRHTRSRPYRPVAPDAGTSPR